jgi:hypothetical protein
MTIGTVLWIVGAVAVFALVVYVSDKVGRYLQPKCAVCGTPSSDALLQKCDVCGRRFCRLSMGQEEYITSRFTQSSAVRGEYVCGWTVQETDVGRGTSTTTVRHICANCRGTPWRAPELNIGALDLGDLSKLNLPAGTRDSSKPGELGRFITLPDDTRRRR